MIHVDLASSQFRRFNCIDKLESRGAKGGGLSVSLYPFFFLIYTGILCTFLRYISGGVLNVGREGPIREEARGAPSMHSFLSLGEE